MIMTQLFKHGGMSVWKWLNPKLQIAYAYDEK